MFGDDIDLNEIFADYFINEFEDPLNAYTSSMANYSGAAAAVALAQKQQQVEASQAPPPSTALPTGGIKTSFHTSSEPAAKKAKVPSATTAPVAKSGLSDRLGFSMPGASPALQHPGHKLAQQVQQVPQQQQQQFQPTQQQQPQVQSGVPMPPQPQIVPSKHPSAPAGVGGLPVGVGIRLGGVGGVAPSTAQLAPGTRPFMMWGGMQGTAGAGMSEQAIAERRQRNREHAKRSRVRKKFMLESLQEQVKQLQKENVELRMIVQQKIPLHAQQIITECCSSNPLFSDPNEAVGPTGRKNPRKKLHLSRRTLV